MTLGTLFLEIVNHFKGLGHLTSGSLSSENYVYFTLTSPDGTKYDFTINKTEAVKND